MRCADLLACLDSRQLYEVGSKGAASHAEAERREEALRELYRLFATLESLKLWAELCGSRFLQNVPAMCLVFTHLDLFHRTYDAASFSDAFKGVTATADQALDLIEYHYREVTPQPPRSTRTRWPPSPPSS